MRGKVIKKQMRAEGGDDDGGVKEWELKGTRGEEKRDGEGEWGNGRGKGREGKGKGSERREEEERKGGKREK